MTRGFLTGLFMGLFVGSIGVLIFAPVEGSKARRTVKDAAHSTRKKVRDIATEAVHKVGDTVDTIKQSI